MRSPDQSSNLLTQVQTIPLDGVEGRIDHFGLDAKGKRDLWGHSLQDGEIACDCGPKTICVLNFERICSCVSPLAGLALRASAQSVACTHAWLGWVWLVAQTAAQIRLRGRRRRRRFGPSRRCAALGITADDRCGSVSRFLSELPELAKDLSLFR
jgi:hypothetical protein